jgi:hypothetical protein
MTDNTLAKRKKKGQKEKQWHTIYEILHIGRFMEYHIYITLD